MARPKRKEAQARDAARAAWTLGQTPACDSAHEEMAERTLVRKTASAAGVDDSKS